MQTTRKRNRPAAVMIIALAFAVTAAQAADPLQSWNDGSARAYDRTSHIGTLDKALDEAQAKGWTVVDMKKDWKVIYPYEKK